MASFISVTDDDDNSDGDSTVQTENSYAELTSSDTNSLISPTIPHSTPDPVSNDKIPIYYRIPEEFGCQETELVTGYLKKRRYNCTQLKRFFGHFTCKRCDSTWTSGNCWQGYRLLCCRCEVYKWPFKVYHKEQSGGKGHGKPHREDLCERCQDLGRNCRQENSFPNYVSGLSHNGNSNEYYNKGFIRQFELFNFNISVRPNFVDDFYRLVQPNLGTTNRRSFIDALKHTKNEWRVKNKSGMVNACEGILQRI